MQKLLILGDSIMKGVIYSEERSRHSILSASQRKLNTALEKAGVELENRARFGATGETVLRETERSLAVVQPGTAVLFGFGGNDSDYDWAAVAADPTGDHRPRTAPEQLRSIWQKCIRIAKDAGCRIFATNLVPIDAEKYFRWISRDKDGSAILRWLGDISMLYRWHEGYSDLLSGLCLEEGVPLVDLREPFLLSHRFKELLCYDGIHPTAAGYGLVDGAISRAVLA